MKTLLQIGVMGSMADVDLQQEIFDLARELGKELAEVGAVLLFGFEGDHDSLSHQAALSAEQNEGKTVAFIWGKEKVDLGKLKSLKVVTGQLRGGGRELALVNSCDGIICIGGGSGTLTEIAFAYQANIPVVVLENSGGWSSKLSGQYLDDRKRQKITGVTSAKQAVAKIVELVQK